MHTAARWPTQYWARGPSSLKRISCAFSQASCNGSLSSPGRPRQTKAAAPPESASCMPRNCPPSCGMLQVSKVGQQFMEGPRLQQQVPGLGGTVMPATLSRYSLGRHADDQRSEQGLPGAAGMSVGKGVAAGAASDCCCTGLAPSSSSGGTCAAPADSPSPEPTKKPC